jgi:hypothetical protein
MTYPNQEQTMNSSAAGLISLALGFLITSVLVIVLSACSGRYIVESGIDITVVGHKISTKHFVFEDCGVTLEEYDGAASVSLYNCESSAYLVVSNGSGHKQKISGIDEYVFKKTARITFDLYPDGKHIHVSNHQIWPDIMSYR